MAIEICNLLLVENTEIVPLHFTLEPEGPTNVECLNG